MAAWSWLPNIAVLSKKYRTYAVDHIGEAGKSVLKDIDVFPKDGEALSDLYLEISNKLEVRRSVIISAKSNHGNKDGHVTIVTEQTEINADS